MIAGGAIGTSISAPDTAAAKTPNTSSTLEPIRIGFYGCGRRAKELADAALGQSQVSAVVTGLADRFGSQTQSMFRMLKGRHASAVAPNCVRASGPECLDELLQSDTQAVYVATPPVDRAQVVRQLIGAGKHVFLEKPLGSDLADVLSMSPLAAQAQRQGLTVFAGLQRRYDQRLVETIGQLHAGLIGEPVFAKAYCNGGPLRKRSNQASESDEDYRLKNWNHFLAAGGDFLVEQHVAGLDVVHWALGRTPIAAQGQGGWSESRTEQQVAQTEVFDHQTVEFDFGDVTLLSQCRRVSKGWNAVGESIHCTEGTLDLAAGKAYRRNGDLIWESHVQSTPKANTEAQQIAFLNSIAEGDARIEIEQAAQSTLIALLGQQATLSKRRIRMDKMLEQAIAAMTA